MKWKLPVALLTALALNASHAEANQSWKTNTKSTSSKSSDLCGWHASFKTGLGANNRVTSAQDSDATYSSLQNQSSGYQLTLEQSVGYSSWINLRLRGTGSISSAEYNDTAASGLSTMHGSLDYGFNADAYLFLPLCINKSAGLSLVPVAGWGFYETYIKGFSAGEMVAVYRNRILAPLVGLYLQLIPNEKFQARGGITAHLPNARQKFMDGGTNYQHLKAARHGIGSELEIGYFVGKKTAVSAKCEYLAFSARGAPTSTESEHLYSSQFSFSMGLKRVF